MTQGRKTTSDSTRWSDRAPSILDALGEAQRRIDEAEAERRTLSYAAHQAGVSTRVIADRIGASSGTVSIWIRIERANQGHNLMQ